MRTTRRTLLARLRDTGDDEAWGEFHALYGPLVVRFARGQGLHAADAEEIRDQCFEVVVRRMPDFAYDASKGSFKAWLFRIVRGKIVDHLRRRREPAADSAELAGLVDPCPTPEEAWNRQWRHEHLLHCLERAQGRVPERSWRAFRMLLLEDATVAEVQAALGLNRNQVYKAKSRVLARVRELLVELGEPAIH